MAHDKKVNLSDNAIQLRIIKAFDKIKLFGPFKHFRMINLLRNLKQPNVITPNIIWKYLDNEFDIKRLEGDMLEEMRNEECFFDDIFEE